jgi:hypothetical protein
MPPLNALPALPDLTPAVREVLAATRDAIVATTGPLLVGLYLGGSLVAGDFDPDVSDLDLIAVLSRPPADELAAALRAMHARLAARYPHWEGRIEAVYVGAADLLAYRAGIPRLGVISPGEPFHVVAGGPDWVVTWYPAGQQGVALVGPPIATVLPAIPRAEYVDAVREYVRRFAERIDEGASRGSQAYAILSTCRGLYTCATGERLSKRRAATWAARQFPEWAGLIEAALIWRAGQWTDANADGAATVAATRRFIAAMTGLLPERPPRADTGAGNSCR